MTPEEKAKAYDKAIKMAKDALNNGTISNNPIAGLQNIFPELMESDDEGIRKKLISYFSAVKDFSTLEYNYGITNEEVVEWLKKQGDKDKLIKELGEYKVKYTQETLGQYLEKQGEQKTIDNLTQQKATNIAVKKCFDKQKSDDKGEQMFHEGDWVVISTSNGRKIVQIVSIEYVPYDQPRYITSECKWFDNRTKARLWDITKDAKDGDVLADKSDGTIGIFQNIGHHPDGGSYNDPSYCFLHCRYDDGYFYADFENGNTMNSDDVIPATKEQHDILMKAMADAGYTFDFKKKKLKEIEHQPDEQSLPYRKNETTEKLIALAECLEADGDCLFNGLSDNNYGKLLRVLARELSEVKPDMWNEDDEKWFKEMELMCLNFSNDTDYRCKFFNWIKSLKDRMQSKTRVE